MSELSKKNNKKLVEEIRLFIEYSVTEEERQIACTTVAEFRENSVALQVINDFYKRLPDFRQEAVTKVSKIVSRKNGYLLVLDTRNYAYLYFYSADGPLYLGEKKDGIGDDEVLRFFGYSSNIDFLNKIEGKEKKKDDLDMFCPACGVAEGKSHELGCPVEICPWCDSQFNHCNCRFDKLGVDEITEERELDRLEIILNDKGRIPFSADHAPGYPRAGEDDD